MSIVLVGSTSGSITLQEPAVAGSNTISLPAATGTAVLTGVSGNVDINAAGSNNVTLSTNSTERVRVDSSGNVGIGTSSPSCRLDLNRGSAGLLANFTDGVNTNFQIETASLLATIGPSAGSTGMAFKTSNTERMRITSGGAAKMTTTGNYRSTSANFYEMNLSATDELVLEMTNETATRPYGFRSRFSAAAPNNTTQYFYTAVDSSTTCFTIWSNGTTSGRSDERLKKNIEDASPKLDDLCKLQVRNYEWKESDGGSKEIGLIAQEVEQVFPSLVITHNIEKQGDDYKEIKYSVFVPMLIKAVQELKGIVDTQATKIAELEAKLEGTA